MPSVEMRSQVQPGNCQFDDEEVQLRFDSNRVAQFQMEPNLKSLHSSHPNGVEAALGGSYAMMQHLSAPCACGTAQQYVTS